MTNQRSGNDALRSESIFPFGLARNAASALASVLRMEPPFAATLFAHPSALRANASPV